MNWSVNELLNLISVKCAKCARQGRKTINGLVDDIPVREGSVNGKSRTWKIRHHA